MLESIKHPAVSLFTINFYTVPMARKDCIFRIIVKFCFHTMNGSPTPYPTSAQIELNVGLTSSFVTFRYCLARHLVRTLSPGEILVSLDLDLDLDNSRQEPEAITETSVCALRKSGEPTLEGRYCVGL